MCSNNLIEKSYKIIKVSGDDNQKTLFFDIGSSVDILPGQFYMLNYNVSQKPFSVSHFENGVLGITILKRGEATSKMVNAKIGEYVGLTGPLGNSFDLTTYDSYLLLGGGVGSAPIYFAAKYLKNAGKKCHVLIGARTKSLYDYTSDLIGNADLIKYYTDDDTGDTRGFLTSGIKEIMDKYKIDTVNMCGPEKMMTTAINELSHYDINIEISMERYMKCGVGICGSCVLDDIGLRVCADGPVFNYNVLKKSSEFGKYHRDSGGIIEKF